MKALITGGAGFVGSHLAEALLARGDEVHVIDNLSTGSIENIEHLKGKPRFHYVIDTIMNEPVLAELVDRVEVVFHLAAAVGVRLIVESPVNTIETNVHGTEMVLKLANKKKKKVLIASTSEVYGKSNDVPFREDSDLVLGPTSRGRWSYACSKAIDEFLAAFDMMLQVEGIDSFVVGGQSYGGLLAQAYLAHRGRAVERLILSSTGPAVYGKAWLPVETHVISREIAREMGQPDLKGFYITQVYPDSTAQKAGLKPVVDSIHDFANVKDAFAKLATGPMGKVLVRVKATINEPTMKIPRHTRKKPA